MEKYLKWTKILLLVVGFLITLNIISNSFDPDFGWHLRFGMEAWNGNFQYTDTYTWSSFGKYWVNHEWGGDLMIWWLYSNFGYFSFVFLTSLAVWTAFVLANKIFQKRITVSSLLVSIVAVISVKYIIIARLAMFGPLFVVLLWWSLEKLPVKKTFYFWPIIFWLWSAMHGSWILGFIVIGIYLAGNIWALIINKILKYYNIKILQYFNISAWPISILLQVVVWSAISGLVILINPYGQSVWTEVLNYFSSGYYKSHITEWVPSYTYPTYWQPMPIVAYTFVLLFVGIKKRMMALPQLILFIAFFLSAAQYKRNGLFLVLLCVPLASAGLNFAVKKLKENNFISSFRAKHLLLPGALLMLFFILIINGIKVDNNLWENKNFLISKQMPIGAFEFLRKKTAGKTANIFNEFRWGGYFNWNLPNALVFFDGRGTATWMWNRGESTLEHYLNIRLKPGGLDELNAGPANYIILQKNVFSADPRPDWFNRLIFSTKDFAKIFSSETPQMEKDLAKSTEWKVVYEDDLAKVWEKFIP